MKHEEEEEENKTDNPYIKVLNDLECMIERKMLEDKMHYSQHEKMDMEKKKPEKMVKEESKNDSDDSFDIKDVVKQFMSKGSKTESKRPAAAVMVSMSQSKPMAKKTGGKRGKSKRA